MIKSSAYLAGVGAYALDYDGPCPFQTEDIGYNDYADGLRDGAPSPMIDGETIEDIAEDRDDCREQCGKEDGNNAILRSAIEDALALLESAPTGDDIKEAIKFLNEAMK